MEEIKLNMENLSEDERKQLMSLIEKANRKKSARKPECGEEYYHIASDGDVEMEWWDGGGFDEDVYALGNCFKTKEEAKCALERQKVIVELERFAREHNTPLQKNELPRFCISFDSKFVSVTEVFLSVPTHKNLCFTSAEIAEEAIKCIGEDRLRKYYFGVEE